MENGGGEALHEVQLSPRVLKRAFGHVDGHDILRGDFQLRICGGEIQGKCCGWREC